MSKRTGIQLCYPLEEKRLAKWEPPYLVQPKLDGERCRAVWVGDSYMLLTSEENIFFSVPHIIKQLNTLNTHEELDGELYCHGMSFEQIHSVVSRTENLHPQHEAMDYHIFDLVTKDIQGARLLSLRLKIKQTADTPNLIPVPWRMARTMDEVMRAYDEYLREGYEGIIVRNAYAPYMRKRSTYVMKFKPKKEDTYKIIDWKEEISKDGIPKGRIGALLCEGDFSVGSGLNDDLRSRLWDARHQLVGRTIRVGYQHMTERGVPRFPVILEVI